MVNGTYSRSSFAGVDLPSYSECFGEISGYQVFVVRYAEFGTGGTPSPTANASVLFTDSRLNTAPRRGTAKADSTLSEVMVGVKARDAAEAEALLRIVAGIKQVGDGRERHDT